MNKPYSVLNGDPTCICIHDYVAFDVKVALSQSKYTTDDAGAFAAKIVALLNDQFNGVDAAQF